MNRSSFCLAVPVLLAVSSATAAAQQISFEDVVRNLRNPDPELRMSAVRLLRDAKYPEAIVPMAALVNDPVNEIQLEVMSAQLSFFLVEDVPRRRKVAFVLERRSDGSGPQAFEMGSLAVWPRRPPPELVKALLNALDDETAGVRLEAVYTLGTIAQAPLASDHEQQLIKALDHYDPAIRAGAARVIARLRVTAAGDALINAMNDSNAQVCFAAMRALGEIADARALKALTDQFTYYGKGEGAWSALDALARIAHPSSVDLFKSRIADRDPNIRRAAAEGLGRTGYTSAFDTLQTAATSDESDMARAAMAFALEKQGHGYLTRLVDFLNSERTARQVQGYLLELGPGVTPALLPRLQEPGEGTRRHLAEVLGAVGDESTVAALTPLLQDRDRDVVQAATHAIARIKMRTQ